MVTQTGLFFLEGKCIFFLKVFFSVFYFSLFHFFFNTSTHTHKTYEFSFVLWQRDPILAEKQKEAYRHTGRIRIQAQKSRRMGGRIRHPAAGDYSRQHCSKFVGYCRFLPLDVYMPMAFQYVKQRLCLEKVISHWSVVTGSRGFVQRNKRHSRPWLQKRFSYRGTLHQQIHLY